MKKRILIADDEEIVIQSCIRILSEDKFQIDIARNGLEAVEKGRAVYLSGRLYRWVDPLFQSVFTRRFFRIPSRK